MIHAGKALVEPEVAVGEALVVDTKSPEDGGIEVVHMDWIFQNIVGVIIRSSVLQATLESTTRDPAGETAPVVIAPVAVLGQFTL